jgi:hypothetical protein
MTNPTALKLVTNDKFKKTLKTSCTVKMFDTVDTFNNFVAVGYNEDSGKTIILQDADALTLGQAFVMVGQAFKKSLAGLSAEKKELVINLLTEGE